MNLSFVLLFPIRIENIWFKSFNFQLFFVSLYKFSFRVPKFILKSNTIMKSIQSFRFTHFIMLALMISMSGCYKMCGKPGDKKTENTEETTPNTSKEGNNENTTTNQDRGSEQTQNNTFTYTPPAPANGKLKGVVELGASGFNSFIVTLDADKHWKLEKADFGASFVYERLANEEDIKDGLKKYISNMLDYGVKGSDIQFVVSSGAMKNPKVSQIMASLKRIGYTANPVTAEQEGKLGARTALPLDFQGNSFVVDIGSGNTKISWEENGQIVSFESYGSKYFEKNISDDQVAKEIASIAAKIPANKRTKCFIIGGAVYDMAKQGGSISSRYTVLNTPSSYKEEGAKMKCGLNIYRSIADATKCDTFVFDKDSNFTIGYLLSLKY